MPPRSWRGSAVRSPGNVASSRGTGARALGLLLHGDRRCAWVLVSVLRIEIALEGARTQLLDVEGARVLAGELAQAAQAQLRDAVADARHGEELQIRVLDALGGLRAL